MPPLFSRDDLLRFTPGTQIGNYRIIPSDELRADGSVPPLGEGGSGAVFLAEQQLHGGVSIKRAIKFFIYRDDIANLSLHKGSGVVSSANFTDELVNLSALNHENLIKIIEANVLEWEGNEIPYLVTEYVQGPTLRDAIETQMIERDLLHNPNMPLDIVLQLARGVAYLHSRSFYHFDIAPKNVFLQSTGDGFRVIIGDLGLGKTLPLVDRRDFFLAGSRNYCPEYVRELLNTKVSAAEFEAMQPEWDLYAIAKTARELIQSLNPEPKIRRPWQSALLLRLARAEGEHPLVSADELVTKVQWLHPVQQTIAQIQELTESYPGNKRQLVPVEQVMTSYRVREIAQHPTLLRLRRVPQLVMASAVFPGANHTRLEHVLGTYEVMRRYLLSLLDDEEFLAFFGPAYVELALVAAMLSNITRFPFSTVIHEIRTMDPRYFTQLSKETLLATLLDEEYSDHETLRGLLELHFPQMSLDRLTAILVGRMAEYHDPCTRMISFLLDSSIDARVIDYLRRDSLHLGISRGDPFDFNEMLNHLKLKDGQLTVTSRALPIVEQIVTFRYWMFGRIYWNEPNRALIAMLRHVFLSLATQVDDLQERISRHVLDTTEQDFLVELLHMCEEVNNPALSEICGFLLRDSPHRFRELIQFNRAEDDARASRVCERVAGSTIAELQELQQKINGRIRDQFHLESDRVHVLLDIPVERAPHKLGEDVNVLTHSGNVVPLTRMSEIVRGAQTGFRDHLQRLRVFINPSSLERVQHRREALTAEVREILLG